MAESASDQRDKRIVRGALTFARAHPPSPNGKLYVRLLDVSFQDAPARIIAEQALEVPSGAGPVPFELHAAEVDERATYVVSAHADLDADGAYSLGDFVTTESYPVLTFGRSGRVDIVLKPVE